MRPLLVLALLAASAPASAGQTITGSYIDVNYSSCGLWNWSSVGRGWRIRNSTSVSWRDMSYPGTAWQQMSIKYVVGGTTYSYTGNSGSCTWSVSSEKDTSSGTTKESTYTFTAGTLTVVKTETWENTGKAQYIHFQVTNSGSSTVSSFRLMHGVDPDHDYGTYSTFSTKNDVRDVDGDGVNDWVESVGPSSGWTVGYGTCDSADAIGHTSGWSTDADASFTDYGGTSGDYTMHWRHKESTIAAGSTAEFGFVVVWDTTASAARTAYTTATALCDSCDEDGDGYDSDSTECGGDDCDDTDASVYPGATETPYDGIDQDCDGSDWTDVDGDGYDSWEVGGSDCHDYDATVKPGATETCDGVDEDCDGSVDEGTRCADDDGDGYSEAGGDCDDADATASPASTETCDGEDEDCDGTVDEGTDCYDDDGDGYTEKDGDCNDGVAAISPAVTEVVNDGIDNDCDGVIDDGLYDPDGDGFLEEGGDCEPEDGASYPGAAESCDGKDNDCDGLVDEETSCGDDDGDGWTEADGDCDDGDAALHPEAEELANGVDDDCDGLVDEGGIYTDDDGDGWTENAGDCDDDEATAYPGAPEAENGVDDDCDEEVDEDFQDVDQDGWTTEDGDCDDLDGWVHPGMTEVCDAIDNDCNGELDEGCADEGEAPDQSGSCGCSTGPTGGLALLPLLAAGLVASGRRRRGLLGALLALLFVGSGCGQEYDFEDVVGKISVDPLVLDAGLVAVGDSVRLPLAVSHLEGADVTITEIAIEPIEGDYFSHQATVPLLVGRGASGTIGFLYEPTREGWHHATITLVSNRGEVEHEITIRGHAVEGSASVWPHSIDFGDVDAGTTAVEDLLLLNDGPVDLELVGAEIEDDALSLDVTLPLAVPAGEWTEVPLAYLSDGKALVSRVRLQLAAGPVLSSVRVQANNCAIGDPTAYDRDGDGYATCGGDCDDDDADVRPGQVESCNGVDDDCDEVVDEGTSCYDDDGDGWTEDRGDCSDGDPSVNPSQTEIYDNGVDDDCDGVVDYGTEDVDGDGYTEDGGDCAPSDASTYPGAPEVADGVDNDCDGTIDEGTVAYDDDGDGYTESGGDCDDSDTTVYSGATEKADYKDNDCDGTVDEGTTYYDDDADGFSELGGDCDDGDADVSPAATEVVGNGVDDDCDGTVE